MRSDQERTRTEFHTTITDADRNAILWRAFSPALMEELIAELPYSIAALDRQGVILATNEAWRRFARENGAPDLANTSVGQDYLETCRRATGAFAEGARETLVGIQAVLDGERLLFTLEYPCPSPTEQRWFLLHVTPLPAPGGGALVSHIEIPRRQAEEEQAQALTAEASARSEAEARAKQLVAIIDAITDPLYVFDREGNILFQNAADRDFMKVEPGVPNPTTLRERGELLKLRDLEGQPLPVSQWPAYRILQGETLHSPKTADIIIHTRDGREVVSSVSGGPIQDSRGNIVGGVLVVRDVTERRRLQRELEERANQLEVIVGSISDGIVVLDRDGNIILQNAADRALTGLAPGEPGPRTLRERGEKLRFCDLHGQSLPIEKWAASRILRGETLRGSHVMDVVFHGADGREAVASISGGPIRDAQGTIVGGVLVTRDVTERRAMEQRTRKQLDALLAMAEALVSPETPAVDTPGADLAARRVAELTRDALGCERISITAVDSGTMRVHAVVRLGWPPEEERQWYEEATHYQLTDLMSEPLIARLRLGETVLSDRAPQWSGKPSPDARKILVAPLHIGAELIGVLGLDFGDAPHTYTEEEMAVAQAVGKLAALVLERDRLLREREEAIANELAARRIQDRMDEFLATATHDLRSPITAGKLAVQIARRRAERQLAALAADQTEKQPVITAIQSNLEVIEGSMSRLAQLVDRLMDVSRVRAGKLALNRERIDLRSIVRQSVAEQRLLTPTRVLRLRLPRHAVTVLADAARMGQVVTNLITNAVRYAPGESPIDITLRMSGGKARLSVRDRGPGIRPEEQPGIWERFRQAEQGETAATKGGGLGLGLYISREIILLHGGQIGVRSAPGRGSTFWFTLPLTDVVAGDTLEPRSAPPT
jgi:PAS domain S-box-containing protein